MVKETVHRCATRTLLLLSFLRYTHGRHYLQAIDPENINLRITNQSNSIVAAWNIPNVQVNSDCYFSNVRHRRGSDEWVDIQLKSLNYSLRDPDWTKDYVFQVRMKYECINDNWSQWGPEIQWKAPNPVQVPSTQTSAGDLLPLLFIPFLILLIYCIFSQKRIRRACISPVPDPKNTLNTILDMDKPQMTVPKSSLGRLIVIGFCLQWWSSSENCCSDCMTVNIEIIGSDKPEEEGSEAVEMASSKQTTITPTAIPKHHAWPANDSTVTPDQSPYVYL